MLRSMISKLSQTAEKAVKSAKVQEILMSSTTIRAHARKAVGVVVLASVAYTTFDKGKLPFGPPVFAKERIIPEDIGGDNVYGGKKPPNQADLYNFIADIVEKTAPAVVKIEMPVYIPFYRSPVGSSGGSGFIISPEGLILTNAHVVANKTSCKIQLADGREFEGTVEAIDERTDLATVRIPGRNLPTIKLGSSAKARPGEWVVALGSPFHLSNSISHGIISSVARHSDEIGHWSNMSYIQTDAAINFGNSGGPLVNINGEAIGVNSMKLSEGIAFAIPSDYVKEFLIQVEEKKKTLAVWGKQRTSTAPRRRYLGVTMISLDPKHINQIRAMYPMIPAVDSGVLIVKIVADSPAHEAGLRPNDVIVSVNGSHITNVDQIYNSLEGLSPLSMKIRRGNQELTITVHPQQIM